MRVRVGPTHAGGGGQKLPCWNFNLIRSKVHMLAGSPNMINGYIHDEPGLRMRVVLHCGSTLRESWAAFCAISFSLQQYHGLVSRCLLVGPAYHQVIRLSGDRISSASPDYRLSGS